MMATYIPKQHRVTIAGWLAAEERRITREAAVRAARPISHGRAFEGVSFGGATHLSAEEQGAQAEAEIASRMQDARARARDEVRAINAETRRRHGMTGEW